MKFMGNIITQMLGQVKMNEVQESLVASMKEELNSFIIEQYGTLPRKTEIHIGDKRADVDGVTHEAFGKVVKFIAHKKPVYLSGPAGSGKNVLCQQVAETLGLDFYFSNAVTQEYKITGFTDANGVYQESQFYKAFKNGGLFMLDEIDASIPETILILNAAIANGYMDFPAPIGKVEKHENFRVIAAGNTLGFGADMEYVGRNQLDAATLNRFRPVKVDYDERIEESCANGDKELLNFARKFRNATHKAGIYMVVSYRNISDMADMLCELDDELTLADLMDGCFTSSMEYSDMANIENEVSGCGRFTEAFREVMNMKKNEER